MDKQLKTKLIAHLEAYDDSNASDGAWEAMLKDGVTNFNETYGTDIDQHDGFMAYISANKVG